MAIGLIMQFDHVSASQYEQVMKELGLTLHDDAGPNWPNGVISHVAGVRSDGGWTVVDVWESKAEFDGFLRDRLGPAFEAVAGTPPQPEIATFEVHNAYHHG